MRGINGRSALAALHYPLVCRRAGAAADEVGRFPPGAGVRGGGLNLVTNFEEEPYPPFFSRLPVIRRLDPADD